MTDTDTSDDGAEPATKHDLRVLETRQSVLMGVSIVGITLLGALLIGGVAAFGLWAGASILLFEAMALASGGVRQHWNRTVGRIDSLTIETSLDELEADA